MTQPQIKITQKLGEPLCVEILNVEGSSCQELTKSLEQLGQTQTTFKPEYYAQPSVQLNNEVNLGS